MFPWTPFLSTKAVVKLYTLLDLSGFIPAFIHIANRETQKVNALDELMVMGRAYPSTARKAHSKTRENALYRRAREGR